MDGVKNGNEVKRRTLEIAPGQAELLQQARREAQSAQQTLQAIAQGVLAGFDDLPDDCGLESIGTEPPELTIRYQAEAEKDEEE